MSYRRIVFLDFDGVMTSMLDYTSHLCHNPSTYGMSKNCQYWLSRLWSKENCPDLKVVLSTSWLKFPDLENAVWRSPGGNEYHCHINELISWLMDEGVYLDRVDYASDSSKFGRIMTWINRNHGTVAIDTKFLVLDDDASQYNLLKLFNVGANNLDFGYYRFIQTSSTVGFDKECLKKSVDFFKVIF